MTVCTVTKIRGKERYMDDFTKDIIKYTRITDLVSAESLIKLSELFAENCDWFKPKDDMTLDCDPIERSIHSIQVGKEKSIKAIIRTSNEDGSEEWEEIQYNDIFDLIEEWDIDTNKIDLNINFVVTINEKIK